MKYIKTFVSGILAGACISFGGIVFLSLESNILGALFFTVGLFCVCTFGLNLFTGKVCYVFSQGKSYALSLPIMWVGNLVGTLIVAFIIRSTRAAGALIERAQTIVAVKLGDDLLSIFLLAILCDIFIYIAVEGFKNNPLQIGKYLALFFGVMVFILCGFEHCVANMFYFSVARVWDGHAILYLMVMTLGNAVGGVIFPLIRGWLGKEKKPQSDVNHLSNN